MKLHLFFEKLKILRVTHWIKNTIIFFPLIFSNNFIDTANLMLAVKIFFHFCLLSSAVYIFNDLLDLEKDKIHPLKKFRPLAKNILNIKEAIFLHIFLIILSLFFISKDIIFISITYLLINYSYSLFLKRIFILDILCVSAGYFLRIYAISLSAKIPLTFNFISIILLVAFFILLSKRYLAIKFSNKNEKENTMFNYFKYYKVTSIVLFILISLFYNNIIFLEKYFFKYTPVIFFVLISQITILYIFIKFYNLVIHLNEDENPVNIFFRNKQIYLSSISWIIYNIILYAYVL